MQKILLVALVLGVAFIPFVQAQAPAHTVSVSISDLPATIQSNGTQVAVPFTVTAAVSGASPCLATGAAGATYTVKLDAMLIDSTGNSTFVYVNPKQVTIAGPVLLPAPGGSAARKIDGTLVVSAGPYTGDFLNATVKVLATFEGSSGNCAGTNAAAPSSAEGILRADFQPVRGFGSDTTRGNEMPGPALAFLLIALVALVAARRQS